ncbi:substrate-binding periplasmic protein [Maridesulfovibrio sp. FT414]|uniref:substrate-binding periplasmic protein n=1 Tax=Maridesulfovibrio sp. FT414 TaxID=2979469 RepID=UPI003D801052
MKKIAGLIFVLSVLLCAQLAFSAEKVTVYGENAYVPYAFLDGNTPDGIYVRILQKAFSKMDGYDVTIELVPWKRALNLVETGRGFACFAPYYRPKQRPWIEPWSEPIIKEGFAAYCRKEALASPRPNWPADYKDLEIGIISGYAVPNKEELKIQESDTNEVNLKKILTGRIDCFVNDDASVRYSMKQMKIPEGQVLKGTQVSNENGYLGFSKASTEPYKDDFVKKFNAVITEMKSNGEIDKIVSDYLGN